MLGINEIRSVTPASKKLKLETFWQEIIGSRTDEAGHVVFFDGLDGNVAGKHKNSTVNSSGETPREATT